MTDASSVHTSPTNLIRFVLLTGQSGAGKSIALGAFEDSGFYCVDNLPATLLVALASELVAAGKTKIACAVDARSANAKNGLIPALERLETVVGPTRRIFLVANQDVLEARFRETRRTHPLFSGAETLANAIARERDELTPWFDICERIDTSFYSPSKLRAEIASRASELGGNSSAALSIVSFGHKRGAAPSCDILFDARGLPNPHWIPELRSQWGDEDSVDRYLSDSPLAMEFVDDVREHLRKWMPRYQADGRRHVSCAIGCTGGRHRSVWAATKIAEALRNELSGASIFVTHRERD